MPESALVAALGSLVVLSGYIHRLYFTRPQAAARMAYAVATMICIVIVGIVAVHGMLDEALLRSIEQGRVETAKIREYVIAERAGARVPGYFVVALSALSMELLAAIRFMPGLVGVDRQSDT